MDAQNAQNMLAALVQLLQPHLPTPAPPASTTPVPAAPLLAAPAQQPDQLGTPSGQHSAQPAAPQLGPIGHRWTPGEANQSTQFVSQPHPFLGGLSSQLDTSLSNQARLSAADRHRTSLPGLPQRSRRNHSATTSASTRPSTSQRSRPRGPAQSLPSTAGPYASRSRDSSPGAQLVRQIEGCIIDGQLNIEVVVFPPLIPFQLRDTFAGGGHMMFRFAGDSVVRWLEDYGLVVRLSVRLEQPIAEILSTVSQQLQSSPLSFQFASSPPLTGNRSRPFHEGLPLQLLQMHDRGRETAAVAPRFDAKPLTATFSFNDMIYNANIRKNFFRTDLVPSRQRLQVYAAIDRYPVTFTEDEKIHRCLSKRFFATFPHDSDPMRNYEEHEDEFSDSSHGEDSHDEDEVTPPQPAPPAGNLSSLSVPAPAPHTPPRLATTLVANSASAPMQVDDLNESDNESVATEIIVPLQPLPSSASTLQNAPLAQSRPSRFARGWSPNRSLANTPCDRSSFGEVIATEAVRGVGFARTRFNLSGRTTEEVAVKYVDRIREAAVSGNFARVAGCQAEDMITNILDEEGTLISTGIGITREVLNHAWQATYVAKSGEFFATGADGYAHIRTLYPFAQSSIFSPSMVTPARLTELRTLGALASILLMNGLTPAPLDPCVFQYAAHEFDLCSVQSILSEWHPELSRDVRRLVQLGPEGPLDELDSFFITWFDCNSAPFRSRDASIHDSVIEQSIYTPIFGRASRDHPEWNAFYEGLSLKSPNGFQIHKAIRGYEGGSDRMLCESWSCIINGISSLQDHVNYVGAGGTDEPLNRLRLLLNDPNLSLFSLVRGFLHRIGPGCSVAFQQDHSLFDPIVDLSGINEPWFRARMLYWASTGAPFIDTERQTTIYFVGDNSHEYLAELSEKDKEQALASGVVKWKTCPHEAFIPISHIVRLAEVNYPSYGEPSSFEQAFDYWLIRQVLSSINAVSIL